MSMSTNEKNIIVDTKWKAREPQKQLSRRSSGRDERKRSEEVTIRRQKAMEIARRRYDTITYRCIIHVGPWSLTQSPSVPVCSLRLL